MRSDFLLKQDRITYEQAKQCVEFVAKQLQEVMLRAVETLVVGVDQIITGKELRQVMVKSFHEYLPDTAGHGKKKVSLGEFFFVKLKERGCSQITDNDLKQLAQDCPNLTTIDLFGCDKITDDAVKHLAQGCPNLTTINLWWCSKITDDAVKHLAQGCPNLTSINLSEYDMITRVMVKVR